jgi:hypothetical protein
MKDSAFYMSEMGGLVFSGAYDESAPEMEEPDDASCQTEEAGEEPPYIYRTVDERACAESEEEWDGVLLRRVAQHRAEEKARREVEEAEETVRHEVDERAAREEQAWNDVIEAEQMRLDHTQRTQCDKTAATLKEVREEVAPATTATSASTSAGTSAMPRVDDAVGGLSTLERQYAMIQLHRSAEHIQLAVRINLPDGRTMATTCFSDDCADVIKLHVARETGISPGQQMVFISGREAALCDYKPLWQISPCSARGQPAGVLSVFVCLCQNMLDPAVIRENLQEGTLLYKSLLKWSSSSVDSLTELNLAHRCLGDDAASLLAQVLLAVRCALRGCFCPWFSAFSCASCVRCVYDTRGGCCRRGCAWTPGSSA